MDKKGNSKYSTIHYQKYLQLDKILGAQHMRSADLEPKPAHEEMLFIIVHQTYELWFKQIIHELTSVVAMFKNSWVDEKNLGEAVERLNRITEILKLLIAQIRVIESMTPMDFLDFRNYLFPASGFQSFQFRQVETILGLREQDRMTYGGHSYSSVFSDEAAASLKEIEEQGSLFVMISGWLERTPFIELGDFDFQEAYEAAVNRMLEKEKEAISNSGLTDKEKEMRLKMLGGTDSYFENVFNEKKHAERINNGEVRLSYNATIAALLISLYREQPILQMPYNLLTSLIDIDELMTTWRYRHAQMVMRMIGIKMGTGGSPGFDYLAKTAEKHRIFTDLHNISSLLIPRSELPRLPEDIIKELGFYYSNK